MNAIRGLSANVEGGSIETNQFRTEEERAKYDMLSEIVVTQASAS